MPNLPYIEAFLSRVEGPCQTHGYIPCYLVGREGTANYRGQGDPQRYKAMGASGVTIATGCDLGQTNARTLETYGLQSRIVELFQPYLGKKRDAALAALHKAPLTISPEDARTTDRAVHSGYLTRWVLPCWQKDSSLNFAAMPAQAQAVVMSLCYQLGCGGVKRRSLPLWDALVRGQWLKASHILCTGFNEYRSRRILEGKLLREIL